MSSFFLRGIGAVCLVVCGWCVGDSICARAQAHQAALQETAELLERIQTEISFRRTDLNRMLASLKRDGFVREEERSLSDPAGKSLFSGLLLWARTHRSRTGMPAAHPLHQAV